MKSVQKFLALLFFSALVLSACHHSDDNSPTNNTIVPAAGVWKVTYFFDKQDETGYYAGYTFEFNANGSMSVSNGAQTWSGTWATGIDDSAEKFLISFNGAVPSALAELAEDWRIVKMEDSFMHFEHTSGGNGDTDVLKFTKI